MRDHTFSNNEREVGVIINHAWSKQVKAAHEAEMSIAMQKGQLHNGKPWICVVVDGGWLKESRGHAYNSTSGK